MEISFVCHKGFQLLKFSLCAQGGWLMNWWFVVAKDYHSSPNFAEWLYSNKQKVLNLRGFIKWTWQFFQPTSWWFRGSTPFHIDPPNLIGLHVIRSSYVTKEWKLARQWRHRRSVWAICCSLAVLIHAHIAGNCVWTSSSEPEECILLLKCGIWMDRMYYQMLSLQ